MNDRFNEVVEEYSTVRISLNAVQTTLANNRPRGFEGIDRRLLSLALRRIDATYLMRLFSIYEDALETALGKYDLKLWELVELGALTKSPEEKLVNAVESHRRRRNDLSHNPDAIDLSYNTSLDGIARDLRRFVSKCAR